MAIRFLLVCTVLALQATTLLSQIEYASWVFGVNAVVYFHDGNDRIVDTPFVANGFPFEVREGSMSYSYPCDMGLSVCAMGETAYDKRGQTVDGGTVLSGGSSSSQGGVFVRDLQRLNSVYLYITPDMTDISTTQVQFYTRNRLERAANGRWEMVERDVALDARPGSERISATHDAAGTGYWVMTQYTDTAGAAIEFVAYHHTPAGIDPLPVVSRFPAAALPHQAGMLKFSPDGSKLAMTNVSDRIVRVYDFNPATGRVSAQRLITLALPRTIENMSVCYGLSFSMSGSNIYVSLRATAKESSFTRSYIFRFQTPRTTATAETTPEIVTHIPLHNTYPSSLQLAPNGKIYFTNNLFLGAITDPETPIGTAAPVSENAVRLATGARSLLGLPTCIESSFLRPTPVLVCDVPRGSVSAPVGCAGNCITITHAVRNVPDTWQWMFPGGTPSTWQGPTPPPICYDAPGRYPIILTATNVLGTTELRDTATIIDNPGVDAGPDIVACMGGPVRLRARASGPVEWTNLSTNTVVPGTEPIVRLDEATAFQAVSQTPCFAVDTVQVTIDPYVEIVRAGASVCRGGSTDVVLYPGMPIEWTAGTDRMGRVDDSTYRFTPNDTFVYEGLLRWADTCTQRLQVTVVVIEKRIVDVQIAPSTGRVGDTLDVNVQVRASSVGGVLTAQLDSLDGVHWLAPWDSVGSIALDSAVKNVTARAVIFLEGPRSRNVTAVARTSDTCSTIRLEPGLMSVEQCALELRQVRHTKPLTITTADEMFVVEGEGAIAVTLYDVLGRQVEHRSGWDRVVMHRMHRGNAPAWLVATQGAQHVVRILR